MFPSINLHSHPQAPARAGPAWSRLSPSAMSQTFSSKFTTVAPGNLLKTPPVGTVAGTMGSSPSKNGYIYIERERMDQYVDGCEIHIEIHMDYQPDG